ncbi:MAG: maltose alpha-D-glucosyltransferase [Acidimicrobiia bacterium]
MNEKWYESAVIYELHVRAFHDSNDDGIGDFRGLTAKLDYLSELGVTAVWLLPFYPSPLRDDGYDIADYRSINPSYGTMRDFRRFLDEAHRRDLKVITELVINHTSDQHPWFQRARRAAPGSQERDFYVWSDTPDLYADARIIFQDTETSNWAWDPVAKAYYWHRFFSHQPDLNFESEAVQQAVFDALDFWLEMGVDGLRLDAVPYLYESDGTMCENLPETHAFLKRLRSHVDANFDDRMLLAEANQWPEVSVEYFGDGDECHMSFHFPLMPRLFMSVKMENNFPVIDIMDQTPDLPEGSAWAIFLRNHDELTLEMVTDEERDYMYRMYASDEQARINVGIRRRLAPLLGNNRRTIELLNAVLFSLPGTPVVYYGDEIGMGDNIYLGDRNGVRTPMQWTGDRNAGFSRANPQRLYFPVITDPEYHYEAINVETQQANPNSLWWWMRRMIAQRKNLPPLSSGTLVFLQPENAKVLAFERSLEDESVLVVANLSRHVQSVELDLSHHGGSRPVEVFGRTPFPRVGELPYLLTLGPHEFYWFRFERASDVSENGDRYPRIRLRTGDADVFRARAQLGRALVSDLPHRRWFRSKASTITAVDVVDVLTFEGTDVRTIVAEVHFAERESETYVVPVELIGAERGAHVREHEPHRLLATVSGTGDDAALIHAIDDPDFGRALVAAMTGRTRRVGSRSEVKSAGVAKRSRVKVDPAGSVRTLGVEQSNTSIVLGEEVILKVFRKLEQGQNPEVELGRFLTERTNFTHTPATLGVLNWIQDGEESAFGFLQEYVANQGDAWAHTVDQMALFIEQVITSRAQNRPPTQSLHPLDLISAEPDDELLGMFGTAVLEAGLLGRRTAQMHIALGSDHEDPAFAPEPMTTLYQRSLYQAMRTGVRQSFQLLRRRRRSLEGRAADLAEIVLEREKELLDRLSAVSLGKLDAIRTRIHGDYHLGQVLFTGNDFLIIDFEGEPARPVSERRIKRSPLRDVAGMIRSYHYASNAGVLKAEEQGLVDLGSEQAERIRRWSRVWFGRVSAGFVSGYLAEVEGTQVIPTDPRQLRTLLDAYLLEKVVYELGYELDNRPDWIGVALDGVLLHLDS